MRLWGFFFSSYLCICRSSFRWRPRGSWNIVTAVNSDIVLWISGTLIKTLMRHTWVSVSHSLCIHLFCVKWMSFFFKHCPMGLRLLLLSFTNMRCVTLQPSQSLKMLLFNTVHEYGNSFWACTTDFKFLFFYFYKNLVNCKLLETDVVKSSLKRSKHRKKNLK